MPCQAKMDPHRRKSLNWKILVQFRKININVILFNLKKMIPIGTVIFFRAAFI